jgi:acetyltransferase-like isoleucine patch superfamily enzyme
VVIIGNAGAARECYWLLRDVMQEQKNLSFKGFLAFEGHNGDLRELRGMELGFDDQYAPGNDDVFLIGIGMPALRLKAFHKWKEKGVRFMNLVHPSVRLVGEVALGEANILAHHCHISCNASLVDANYLNGSVVVGHDTRIGSGNFFAPFCMALGDVSIGDGNAFGLHSAALAGAKIGHNNRIAPGAYVYKGCGDNRVLAGNPALDMK